MNAYGYDYIHAMLVSGHSVLSYQRRFPVVYLTVWAMRRPLIVNTQRRSALFCYTLNPYWTNPTNLTNRTNSTNKKILTLKIKQ